MVLTPATLVAAQERAVDKRVKEELGRIDDILSNGQYEYTVGWGTSAFLRIVADRVKTALEKSGWANQFVTTTKADDDGIVFRFKAPPGAIGTV